MPRPTHRALLTAALLARGYAIDCDARTERYVVFRPTPGARILLKPSEHDLTHRVFAGPSGALRFSSTGAVTRSVPFSDRTVALLLAEGWRALAEGAGR